MSVLFFNNSGLGLIDSDSEIWNRDFEWPISINYIYLSKQSGNDRIWSLLRLSLNVEKKCNKDYSYNFKTIFT